MSTKSWLEPEELRVFRSYIRSTKALFMQFDRDLEREVGMPRTFFEILWSLDGAPDHAMRMSELAERTGSQASRITHAIAKLEKDGQVRREHCADDRRGWFAVLTDEGAEALRHAAPAYARSIRDHLFTPLSSDQHQQLVGIGEAILDALDSHQYPTANAELAGAR